MIANDVGAWRVRHYAFYRVEGRTHLRHCSYAVYIWVGAVSGAQHRMHAALGGADQDILPENLLVHLMPSKTEDLGAELQARTTHVADAEGGPWIPFVKWQSRGNRYCHTGRLIHAIAFEDGSIWDAYNGWRKSTETHPRWIALDTENTRFLMEDMT